MNDTHKLTLKSGEVIVFEVRPFHYRNLGLRRTFNSEYPTIVALYKRKKSLFERVSVKVVENPRSYFNDEPIDDELKEITTVLSLKYIALPPTTTETIDYLERLRYEIIEQLGTTLTYGLLE